MLLENKIKNIGYTPNETCAEINTEYGIITNKKSQALLHNVDALFKTDEISQEEKDTLMKNFFYMYFKYK